MNHLLEIANIVIEDPRLATSSEDFLKSAQIVREGVEKLINSVQLIQAEESMGHLPHGVSSKAKKLVLDLLVQQTSDIQKISNILQHIISGAGNG